MADNGHSEGVSCQPCHKRHRKFKSAVKYCVICKEFMCTSCVTSHNSFSSMAAHTFQDLSGNETSEHLLIFPTEICQTHKSELINMYCSSHDVVGCAVCIMSEHRKCPSVHYIPEYVQNKLKRVENMQIETLQMKQQLEALKTSIGQVKEKLTDSKTVCEKEIGNFQDELKNIIARLKEKSLLELDNKVDKVQKEITELENQVEVRLTDLEKRNSKMELNKRNPSQSFVAAKMYQAKAKEINKFVLQHLKSPNVALSYSQANDVKVFLSKSSGLGKIDTLPMNCNNFIQHAWSRITARPKL